MDIFGAYSIFSKPLWILRHYYNRAVISIQRQLKHRETQILFHLSTDFGVSDFWFPKMWLFWGEVAFLLNSQMSWVKCVSIKVLNIQHLCKSDFPINPVTENDGKSKNGSDLP